ncbi:hypothetical protein M0802_009156 [Mischocyttarus mexicanus]|nr:hypothetical protein M0802_009156 [Mischocyttarus mexicanus]
MSPPGHPPTRISERQQSQERRRGRPRGRLRSRLGLRGRRRRRREEEEEEEEDDQDEDNEYDLPGTFGGYTLRPTVLRSAYLFGLPTIPPTKRSFSRRRASKRSRPVSPEDSRALSSSHLRDQLRSLRIQLKSYQRIF